MASTWPALDWPQAMVVNGLYLALSTIVTTICLVLVSIVTLVSKAMLALGASLAPLVLPFAIIPGFLDVGLGPVRFLLRASLSYIGTAAVAALVIRSVMGLITVGGVDVALATDQANQLMILSLLGAVMSMAAGGIGAMVVGGGGTVGASSSGVMHTGSTIAGGASSAASGAAAAGRAASSASIQAGNAMRAMSSGGSIGRSPGTGGGSAFS